jgi:hypothetical protein
MNIVCQQKYQKDENGSEHYAFGLRRGVKRECSERKERSGPIVAICTSSATIWAKQRALRSCVASFFSVGGCMLQIASGQFYLYGMLHEVVGVVHTERVSDILAWRSERLNSV